MTPESGELLSSMVDGAAVDPDRLAIALAEPDAFSVLVDFSRIRLAVESDQARPGGAFYGAAKERLASAGARRIAGRRVPLAAAAALVLCAVVTGLGLGRLTARPTTVVSAMAAYCTDASGVAHAPGVITAIDDRRVQCVLKGEWKPVRR